MTKIADDRIWEIWEWCSGIYLQNGIRIDFPKHTDPRKTYQWRYLEKIASKFEEWDFDPSTSKRFIEVAVAKSKSNGTLRKGLAALHQKNMIEICLAEIDYQAENDKQLLSNITRSKRWLDQKTAGKNVVNMLLRRPEKDAFLNITSWYQSKKLTDIFIALSKSCYRSLRKIQETDKIESKMLPSMGQLYNVRKQFVKDKATVAAAKNILGEDWRSTL